VETRILVSVAGAHDIVASGLRTLLSSAPDVEVLDTPLVPGTFPDVIVYDAIGLHTDGGAELRRLITHTDSAVLVIGRDLRPDLAARAMAHGASGIFSLESDRDSVLELIRRAASGELNPQAAKSSMDVLGTDTGLSRREVDVLGEITRGLSNEEIAAALCLSTNTIKSYIRSAYRRLGVESRAQAVAWCLLHGFDPSARSGAAGELPDPPDRLPA
jgi:DNA-binding NarL/FixJ family response regulator